MSQSSTFVPSGTAHHEEPVRRFPFQGFPKGWFAVALSGDVSPGGVERLHYFGRDLVLYRSASGKAHVTGAYCPHLGAHLGHGGKVEGETLRCPFHGWRFDGGGQCVDIPYCDRIPPKARLDALPVKEQNGVVFAYWDPQGGPPFELPELDDEGWTPGRVVHWRSLRTHAQEVFENTMDTAHIGPIHAGRGARIVGKPRFEAETLNVDIEFQAPGDIVGMPDQINDVLLHVTMRGLGWTHVLTEVRNVGVRARQRIYVTPVDEETVDIRGIVHVQPTDDAAFTEDLARLFYTAYVDDFAKDFPIWENKRYLDRPLLAKGDGPIGLYRRWCTQFYGPLAEKTRDRAAPEAPDVPASALRARDALRNVFAPAQRRIAMAAETLLAFARTRREDAPASSEPREATAQAPTRSEPASSEGFRVESATEYFETLEKRFVPRAAAGVDAVFQWELGGEGGGVFHACVRDGSLALHRGAHERPTVSLVMDAPTYVRVVNGELDGMRAFTTGGGKVKGSIAAAMKMRSLFPGRSSPA